MSDLPCRFLLLRYLLSAPVMPYLPKPCSHIGKPKESTMEIIVLQPIVALIAGILILIMPHLLNYIVAVYLIVIGLVGLLNQIA